MFRPLARSLLALSALTCLASAEYMIESSSLQTCQDNSLISASLFDVVFTPKNRSVSVTMDGFSAVSGNIKATVKGIVYGYTIKTETVDPCKYSALSGFCPMNSGPINIPFNFLIGQDVVDAIPNVAYTIPDLDGKVQLFINDTNGNQVACVEAELSNGQTVYHKSVSWVTAVIAGLGLTASAITSRLGHLNTATHVAANALALFGYFQAQALIGLTSVDLPPIVQSWTQNFQWSMGIIHVGFLQEMCTWYQRATGGTPTNYLSDLGEISISVQKRDTTAIAHSIILRGIERVGFRANIEISNIFLTSYSFLVLFVLLTALSAWAFEYVNKKFIKKNIDGPNVKWAITMKGVIVRIVLISLPAMSALCAWELKKRDSAAEAILAILTLFFMLGLLGWGLFRVFQMAKFSVKTHGNPAYLLYSDAAMLERWGSLYVHYIATSYWFGIPFVAYIFIKGIFIGAGQGSGTVQAIVLVLIEVAVLIAVSILKPYMDKRINILSISVAVVNFLSAIFLLIFSNIFGQPAIVTGVVGVVFFLLNVIFAFILILFVLVSSIMAVISKNPETRYQPMLDDRGSFIKSHSNLITELDALGATARGEKKDSWNRPSLQYEPERPHSFR